MHIVTTMTAAGWRRAALASVASTLVWGMPVAAQEFINSGVVSPSLSRATGVTSPVQGGLQDAAAALAGNQPGRAVEIYRQLINTNDEGQRALARYGLAFALDRLGQDDKALEILEGTPADETPLGQAVGDLRGRLLLQLADKAWWTEAREKRAQGVAKWLATYERLTVQPDMPRYQRLRSYLTVPTSQVSTLEGPLTVGVLLPLSGPMAPVGQEILQGLQMGLADRADQGGDELMLKPFDTVAVGAKKAAEAALAAGAQVIVGPLRASEVMPVKTALRDSQVPILDFSSEQDAVEPGNWSVAYSPAGQAKAVARWALANGHLRVAGLVPSNAYGSAAWGAFQQEVKRLGGQIDAVSFYNPQNVDISASVRGLMDGKPKGQPGFTALFIPAPASTLPLVVAQLATHDLDRAGLQLLGTALWQGPETLRPSARALRGGVFAAPARVPDFDAHYQQTFGTAPTASLQGLAGVAADVGRVLADVQYLHLRSRNPVSELLLREEGFIGHGGYLRLMPDGESRRGYSVVQVGQNQFTVLEPAPQQRPLPLPETLLPADLGRNTRLW